MQEVKNHSKDTMRIARNTLSLYIRSFINLILSLYTSRIVLDALGVEDYGVYNVVGGFVSMFWLITSSVTTSITRFFNYEMGLGNEENLRRVFRTSLLLMFISIVLILIPLETFGVWYIKNKMVIPYGRESVAMIVFQVSIFSSMVSLFFCSYGSAIVAHERMGVYAFTSILETVLLFVSALMMRYLSVDLLIFYAIVRLGILLLVQTIIITYSTRHFAECSFGFSWDRNYLKNLFSFSGWSLLGSISTMFGNHGVNLALNHFFGTVVNAARGLAFTVSNSVGIFVNNFTVSIVPQITKSYAGNDLSYMKKLIFYGSKLSFFIMLFFVMPLVIETPYVLNLWLKEVPEYTVNFVRLALLISLIGMLDGIIWQAQRATGKIRKNQIFISTLGLLVFVLSYIALRLGFRAESVYVVTALCAMGNVVVNVSIITKSLKLPLSDILRSIFMPEMCVAALSFVIPFSLHYLLPLGFLRFLLVCASSFLCIVVFAFLLGFSKKDQNMFLQKLFRISVVIYSRYLRRKNKKAQVTLNISGLESANELIYSILAADKPCMIARYGRTELQTMSNYLGVQSKKRNLIKCIKEDAPPWWWYDKWRNMLGVNAGFFPLDDDSVAKFCELMLQDTKQVDILGSWAKEEKYFEHMLAPITKVSLFYLEPFFADKPWTRALSGKKVLVIHPFAELIEEQYKNKREKLFSNPQILPNFQLQTLKAVQSMGGEGAEGFKTWFEALDWMKEEINKKDFDIALIGCGAYGFPLAAYIKRMGKKAFHLGGVLQVLFGIIGERWCNAEILNHKYSDMFNEYWVRPGAEYRPEVAPQVDGGCYW